MRSMLVLVLPGGGYGPQGAALRFPLLAIGQLGRAESKVIKYPAIAPDMTDASAVLIDDVGNQVVRLVRESKANEVVFVAKSLGTRALAGVSQLIPRNVPVSAVWLTPLFGVPDVRESAAASGLRSLIVAGDADPHHDQDGFSRVASALDASTLLAAGADHSLEVPGDVHSSIRVLQALSTAIVDFMG